MKVEIALGPDVRRQLEARLHEYYFAATKREDPELSARRGDERLIPLRRKAGLPG